MREMGPARNQRINGRESLSRGRATPDSRVLLLDRGGFDPSHLIDDPEMSFGILILDGLIMARLEAGRAHTGWLVGADDLLRPWEMSQIALTQSAAWQVLTPARIIRLDTRLLPRLRDEPRLVQDLLARATRTTHWLFAKALVISSPSIEERLVLLFALFGERWGKVRPEGIWIELPLTHALIALLCGARRPSVSVALRSLEERGILMRNSRLGWLLRRAPDLDARWPQYLAALGPALGRTTVRRDPIEPASVQLPVG